MQNTIHVTLQKSLIDLIKMLLMKIIDEYKNFVNIVIYQ